MRGKVLKVAAVAVAAALTSITATAFAKLTSNYKEKGRRKKLDAELAKIESKIIERDK